MTLILVFVNAVGRNSGAFMAYTYAYWTLEQEYVCSYSGYSDSYETCTKEQLCEARSDTEAYPYFKYKPDEDYQYYFNNWYTELDLVCEPASAVSNMFLWYFIGTIVATFFAAVPDALGRKKTVWYFFTLSVIA